MVSEFSFFQIILPWLPIEQPAANLSRLGKDLPGENSFTVLQQQQQQQQQQFIVPIVKTELE